MTDLSLLFKSPQKDSFEDYTEDFQLSLAKYLIEDTTFLQQVIDSIQPEYFTYGYLQHLMNYVLAFYKGRRRVPKIDEIKQDLKTATGIQYRDEIRKNLDRIKRLDKYGKDYVKDIAIKFFKSQEMIKAIGNAMTMLQKPYEEINFDNIFSGVKNAYNKCMSSNEFYNWKKDFPLRYPSKEEIEKALSPSGFETLDAMMQGGLGIGEVAVVTGGSGLGKSMFLVHVGSANVIAGKRVWHITLELSKEYTGRRYDARITGIPSDELYGDKDRVYDLIHETEGNILMNEYPAYAITMDRIYSDYERLVSLDFEPDSIIIDYADLLLADNKKQGFSTDSLYNALGIVYNKMRNFGKEVGAPIWSASQVNRKGIESGGNIKDLSDMSDSMKKAHFADVIIALQRTEDMKQQQKANLLIKKNRRGPSDVTIALHKVDLSKCYFEENKDETFTSLSDDDLKFRQRNLKNLSTTLEERMKHASPNDIVVKSLRDIKTKSIERKLKEELREEEEIAKRTEEEKVSTEITE